jgi:hypothetical protein
MKNEELVMFFLEEFGVIALRHEIGTEPQRQCETKDLTLDYLHCCDCPFVKPANNPTTVVSLEKCILAIVVEIVEVGDGSAGKRGGKGKLQLSSFSASCHLKILSPFPLVRDQELPMDI